MAKINPIFLVLAAILLIVAVVGLVFYFAPQSLPIGGAQSPVPGFATLGWSQQSSYSPTDNDNFCNGSPSYNGVIVANGNSQYATGSLDVNALNPGASGPFNLTTVLDTGGQCTFAIFSTPTPIYQFAWEPVWVYGPWSSGGGTCSPQYRYLLSSGCSPAHCEGGSPCGCYPAACAGITKTKIGDMYQIQTQPEYLFHLNVSMQTLYSTYSFTLSPQVPESDIAGAVKMNSFGGGFVGTVGCPVPAVTTVLYRPVNTNTLIPKSKAYYSQMFELSQVLPSDPSPANTQVNNFIASVSPENAYCDNQVTYSPTARYACTPSSPVTIPVVNTRICASAVEQIIPHGIPEIISVAPPVAEAANMTRYDVLLRNNGGGNQADSFDVYMTGKYNCNTQAVRDSILPGQQKTVQVRAACVGIIGNYTIWAQSVNYPDHKDNYTFKLEAEPYCDKEPEAGKVKVSTEYGCQYVCAQSGDVRENNCMAFGTFESSHTPYERNYEVVGSQNVITNLSNDSNPSWSNITSQSVLVPMTQDFPNEYHCTGIGSYTSLNSYMDAVNNGAIQPFVATPMPNAYWVGTPVCNYFGAFGYTWNGQQAVIVDDLEYYDQNGNAPTQPQGQSIPIGSISCPSGYTFVNGICNRLNSTIVVAGNESGGSILGDILGGSTGGTTGGSTGGTTGGVPSGTGGAVPGGVPQTDFTFVIIIALAFVAVLALGVYLLFVRRKG